MKHVVFLLLLAVMTIGCDKVIEPNPPKPTVPDAVVQAISTAFSTATDVSVTTLSPDELYAADFRVQTQHYQALIGQDGAMLALRIEHPVSDLPFNGQGYIDSHYPNPEVIFLYEEVNPNNGALLGYFAKAVAGGKNYLLSFDPLGARISTMEEPNTGGWYYALHQYSDLPSNIRSKLELTHPPAEFQGASILFDANQSKSWQVGMRNSNHLLSYQFDKNATQLQQNTEDLLGTDPAGLTVIELDSTSLPTLISDHLNSQFVGWTYDRGIFIMQNTTPLGFSVMATVNQVLYFIRYDLNGNFTGATKG